MEISAWTTAWGGQRINLKFLRFCRVTGKTYREQTQETIYELPIGTATTEQVRLFFKQVSGYYANQKRIDSEEDYCQFFAVSDEDETQPVKWFWVKSSKSSFAVGHDIAFDTVLIEKVLDSGTTVQLTRLNLNNKRWAFKHARSKMARDAYRVMANLFGRNL